jgi:hypothetical protein
MMMKIPMSESRRLTSPNYVSRRQKMKSRQGYSESREFEQMFQHLLLVRT